MKARICRQWERAYTTMPMMAITISSSISVIPRCFIPELNHAANETVKFSKYRLNQSILV